MEPLNTLPIPSLTAKRTQQFWEKISKSDDPNDCWIANLPIRGKYATFSVKSRCYLAHRIAYAITVGQIPEGLCVLHKCDVRRCCNPNHLFLGTNADNISDKKAKGRSAKGEMVPSSVLKESDVLEIRRAYSNGIARSQIAYQFNVSLWTVAKIVTRRSWVHLP